MGHDLIGVISVLIGIVSVGAALALFIWRISVRSEDRSDAAHAAITETIGRVEAKVEAKIAENIGTVEAKVAENIGRLEAKVEAKITEDVGRLEANPSLTRLPSTRLLSTGYKGRIAQVALQTR